MRYILRGGEVEGPEMSLFKVLYQILRQVFSLSLLTLLYEGLPEFNKNPFCSNLFWSLNFSNYLLTDKIAVS